MDGFSGYVRFALLSVPRPVTFPSLDDNVKENEQKELSKEDIEDGYCLVSRASEEFVLLEECADFFQPAVISDENKNNKENEEKVQCECFVAIA